MCKDTHTGVCLNVNPSRAGGAYGYVDMGGWIGGQAEYVLVPYADFNLLKFPDRDQAMSKIRDLTCLSDILPTGYHGAVSAGVKPGSTVYIAGAGPVGTGMEETYQLTSALKHLPFGRHVALVTDARFSGVSTGACIGHVGPEALAGGPIGRVRDGDVIRIRIDRERLEGELDLVGVGSQRFDPEEGARLLAGRTPHPDLAPHSGLPADTRLWAALQRVGGGTWGGCVYDAQKIAEVLERGLAAERVAP